MKCRKAQMTRFSRLDVFTNGLLADAPNADPRLCSRIVTKSDVVMIYNLDPSDSNIKQEICKEINCFVIKPFITFLRIFSLNKFIFIFLKIEN
jgi:hypothetical protein